MTYRRPLTIANVVLAIGVAVCPAGAEAVIHVDDDTSLAKDGTSWPVAFKHLQDVLAVATGGDAIRVAGGTYRPDEDEAASGTPGSRAESFRHVDSVAVHGGYAGLVLEGELPSMGPTNSCTPDRSRTQAARKPVSTI